jgi:hypothetical protein
MKCYIGYTKRIDIAVVAAAFSTLATCNPINNRYGVAS